MNPQKMVLYMMNNALKLYPSTDLFNLFGLFEPTDWTYLHHITKLPTNVVMRIFARFNILHFSDRYKYTVLFTNDNSSRCDIPRNQQGLYCGVDYILFSFENEIISIKDIWWDISDQLKQQLKQFVSQNAKLFIDHINKNERPYRTELDKLPIQFNESEPILVTDVIPFFISNSYFRFPRISDTSQNADVKYRLMVTFPNRGNVIVEFARLPITHLILNDAELSEEEFDYINKFITIYDQTIKNYIDCKISFNDFLINISKHKFFIYLITHGMTEYTNIESFVHVSNMMMVTMYSWDVLPNNAKYNVLIYDTVPYNQYPYNLPKRYVVFNFESTPVQLEIYGTFTNDEMLNIKKFIITNTKALYHIVDINDGEELFTQNVITNAEGQIEQIEQIEQLNQIKTL